MKKVIIEAIPVDTRGGKDYYDLTIDQETVDGKTYLIFDTDQFETKYRYEIIGSLKGVPKKKVKDLLSFKWISEVIKEFCELVNVELVGGGEWVKEIPLPPMNDVTKKWEDEFHDSILKLFPSKFSNSFNQFRSSTSWWDPRCVIEICTSNHGGVKGPEIKILIEMIYGSWRDGKKEECGDIRVQIGLFWSRQLSDGFFSSTRSELNLFFKTKLSESPKEKANHVFDTINQLYANLTNPFEDLNMSGIQDF